MTMVCAVGFASKIVEQNRLYTINPEPFQTGLERSHNAIIGVIEARVERERGRKAIIGYFTRRRRIKDSPNFCRQRDVWLRVLAEILPDAQFA